MNYEAFKVKAQQLVGSDMKLVFMSSVATSDGQNIAIVRGADFLLKNQPVSRNIKKVDSNDRVIAVYNDDLELIEEIEPKGWTEIEC